MKKKTSLFLLLPAVTMIASGCDLFGSKDKNKDQDNTQQTGGEGEGTGGGGQTEAGKAEKDHFNAIVQKIKTLHNYTIEISSSFAEDEDAHYEGILVNIDDKAIYAGDEYSGYEGMIKQGNQGYVRFMLTSSAVLPFEFMATTAEKGASELFQICAESLIGCVYTQDSTDKTKFVTTDEYATLIAYNMCGFQAQSGGEEVICHIDLTKEELLFEYHYWVIDDIDDQGNPVNLEGTATFRVKNIGTTSNSVVSAYIANPTKTYDTPVAWSASQEEIFEEYFNGTIPPFIPNASYTLTVQTEDMYNGVHVKVEDLLCGNKIEAYASLIKALGFAKQESEDGEMYTKTVINTEKENKCVYTILMNYENPTEYFPNGIFKVDYDSEILSTATTEADFNNYVSSNNLGDVVPLLKFNNKLISVSFRDATENMNQLYGNYYRFWSKAAKTYDCMKLKYNKEDAESIKSSMYTYISDAYDLGYVFSEIRDDGTIVLAKRVMDSSQSFIQITNPETIQTGEGVGTFDLMHRLYLANDPLPAFSKALSAEKDAHVTSVTFKDMSGEPITSFTDNYSLCFFMYITFESGYELKSISLTGDNNCSAYFDEVEGAYLVEPGNFNLSEFKFGVESKRSGDTGKTTVTLGSHGNATIKLDGTYDEVVEYTAGQTVTFTVTCPTLYQVDSLTIKDIDDNEYQYTEVNVNGTKTTYSFTMPSASVTIRVETSLKDATKYSYSAQSGLTGGTIQLESGTATKGSYISFTVSPSSGYSVESVFVVGDETIDVTENALHPGTYTFKMPDKNVVISATFVSEAPAKTLSSISVEGGKTSFAPGDAFSYEGLVVTAHYSDNTTAIVTPTSVTCVSLAQVGKKWATVTYKEGDVTKTVQYQVFVSSSLSFVGDEHVSLVKYVDWNGNEVSSFSDNSNKLIGVQLNVTEGYGVSAILINDVDCSFDCYYDEYIDAWVIYVSDISQPSLKIEVHTLELEPTPAIYTVSKSQGTGTQIKIDGTWNDTKDHEVGSEVKATIKATTGYENLQFTIKDSSGNDILYQATGVANEYSFTMPESNVVISATATEIQVVKHTVSKVSGLTGGTIQFIGEIQSGSSVDAGSTVPFTVKASEGYQIKSIFVVDHPEIEATWVDGLPKGHYEIVMPDFDIEISAEFEALPVELSSITVSGAKTEFEVGEEFSSDGLVVTAHYSDSSTQVITPSEVVAPDMSTAGTKDVVVKYTENNVEKIASYQIVVADGSGQGTSIESLLAGATFSANCDDSYETLVVFEFTANGTGTASFSSGSGFLAKSYVQSFSYSINDLGNGKYSLSISSVAKVSGAATGLSMNISNFQSFEFEVEGSTICNAVYKAYSAIYSITYTTIF